MYWSKRPGEMEWPLDSICIMSWMNQKLWQASQKFVAPYSGTRVQLEAMVSSSCLRRGSVQVEASSAALSA